MVMKTKSKNQPLKIAVLALIVIGSLVLLESLGKTEAQTNALASSVTINELMADNSAAVESPMGTFPDWVELYNGGNSSVDISGWYLTDNTDKANWQFAEGTIIEKGGYLVIWADGDTSLGPLHTDFKLNANGETLRLLQSDAETLVDSVRFYKQIQDVSYGRLSDGEDSWFYFAYSTPGAANVKISSSEPADWPIWALCIGSLSTCFVYAFRDKLNLVRKSH
jgi:hypothetical protein